MCGRGVVYRVDVGGLVLHHVSQDGGELLSVCDVAPGLLVVQVVGGVQAGTHREDQGGGGSRSALPLRTQVDEDRAHPHVCPKEAGNSYIDAKSEHDEEWGDLQADESRQDTGQVRGGSMGLLVIVFPGVHLDAARGEESHRRVADGCVIRVPEQVPVAAGVRDHASGGRAECCTDEVECPSAYRTILLGILVGRFTALGAVLRDIGKAGSVPVVWCPPKVARLVGFVGHRGWGRAWGARA